MQPSSFKKLMRKQILLAILISFVIALPVSLIPGYFILKANIENDIKTLKKHSEQQVNQYLATGWQTHNIESLLKSLNQTEPMANFYLRKGPAFTDPNTVQTHALHANDEPPVIDALIDEIEGTKQATFSTDLTDGYLYAAYPVQFQQNCLSCHAEAVRAGQVFVGQHAGTIAFKAPISLSNVSSLSTLLFFVTFFAAFILIGLFLTERFLQAKLMLPLQNLSGRISDLKLDTHDQKIDWQRTPQDVLEIDQMDANISEHIHTIQRIYNKLDALIVTEHETGLFHRERFNEVMQYELLRSRRYQHPLSLIVIKLIRTIPSKKTAKDSRATGKEQENEVQTFGRLIIQGTRVTDLAFRISDNLFVVIAPETDAQNIQTMQQHLRQRLIQGLSESNRGESALDYQFEFKMGCASYGEEDGTFAKQILHSATQRMQQDHPQQ